MNIDEVYLFEKRHSKEEWFLRTYNGIDLVSIDLAKEYPYISEALITGDIKPLHMFCKLQGWRLVNQYSADLKDLVFDVKSVRGD